MSTESDGPVGEEGPADTEALDSWLEGITSAKHGKQPRTINETTFAERLGAYRKPPVTVGYLYLTRVYHCMKCGEVSPHFEGVYRAETEVGMRNNSLVKVEAGALQPDLPTHFLERHRNVEQCPHCIPQTKSVALQSFEGLLP